MLTRLSIIFLFAKITIGTDTSSNCCCCSLSSFWELNRTWTTNDKCLSPKICCNIPSQYECELELNPTYDGTCGHMNEESYQKEHGGPLSVVIPRSGYDELYEVKGWFGQRFMDEKGNEIQEWCFNNDENDSFFLFRFVGCDGSYPHWFGRCVFPSANNALIYSSCDDINDFSSTIPTCFGEIQEINIGENTDYGKDVDYRYDVSKNYEWIWCSVNNKPENPPNNCLYSNTALGDGDGIVPFYLQQCRNTTSISTTTTPNVNVNNDRVTEVPQPISDSIIVGDGINENPNNVSEMKPISFRVNVKLDESPIEVDINDNDNVSGSDSDDSSVDGKFGVKYHFGVNGNNMPGHYHATLNYGDSWSLGLKLSNDKILNVEIPDNWSYQIKEVDYGSYITFINKEINEIKLVSNKIINGFKIFVSVNQEYLNKCQTAGWIARSNEKNGRFVGYGKIDLC